MIVERESIVEAPADEVWARVVTLDGINDELWPWMTMSMPRGANDLTIDTMPVGIPIGRCWMRAFGVLPFDYDDFCLTERHPLGFREDSTMLMVRHWRHERTVTPEGSKSVVHERLTFELRAPLRLFTPVYTAVVRALFTHRQRRLQRHFASN
jgi:ligand-binding SRPBCC domain-containing protein